MMEQYTGDFLAAIDGLRALLGCEGRVWPASVDHSSICAEYSDGTRTAGEVEVDALQRQGKKITRLWLDPPTCLYGQVAEAIRRFQVAIIGPGSFYTSLMPPLLVSGMPEALRAIDGPIVLVANLLTEGPGMNGFTAADEVRAIGAAIGRPVDVVLVNTRMPTHEMLARYETEGKHPLAIGDVPPTCEVVEGGFWTGEFARHSRRRLSYALWSVIAQRLLV
jgi:uncharacterized cofD-like protein